MLETWVQSLGWEDPLEKGTATHSSILAWRIPRTKEPGGLQAMGLQRVARPHDFHFHFKLTRSSTGKESACNAGDLGSIPGWARSPGEGKGHPLQYSWASLVAQLVKNLPAMRETWVQSLGWEDPPGEGKGYPLQYSWASFVAQLVKNLPATRETCIRSLGWEDPLKKGKATHSSILA